MNLMKQQQYLPRKLSHVVQTFTGDDKNLDYSSRSVKIDNWIRGIKKKNDHVRCSG